LAGCYAPRPGFLTNLRFWQMLGGEVQIVVQKRHLALHALSPFRPIRQGVALHRMDESDPLRFAFELDGLVVPVAFDKDASGLVERMVIGRPVNAILYPRPALRSSRLRLRLAAAGALAIGFRRVRRRRKTT
jgi:hypothetical protein